jgi:hypothetical protein
MTDLDLQKAIVAELERLIKKNQSRFRRQTARQIGLRSMCIGKKSPGRATKIQRIRRIIFS